VCVTPESRVQAAKDNQLAAQRQACRQYWQDYTRSLTKNDPNNALQPTRQKVLRR
jgi:hypothetical protein